MPICQNPECRKPFERQLGKYCCTACRYKVANRKYIERQAQRDEQPKQYRILPMRHAAAHAVFIDVPQTQGDMWPMDCTFTHLDIVNTIRLGYFPAGSRFREGHRVYTICGKQAVSGDGEIIS